MRRFFYWLPFLVLISCSQEDLNKMTDGGILDPSFIDQKVDGGPKKASSKDLEWVMPKTYGPQLLGNQNK